jgi:hypothetical protein
MIQFVSQKNRDVKVTTSCAVHNQLKVKATHYRPGQALGVKAPRFLDNQRMKVVRLSALRTGRIYPAGNTRGTHFCYILSRSQGHSATDSIMSKKNSNDTIGERNGDLSVFSAVPQATEPPRTCTIS